VIHQVVVHVGDQDRKGDPPPKFFDIRLRLRAVLADVVPIEVALSLEGLDDDEAWAMRVIEIVDVFDARMAPDGTIF